MSQIDAITMEELRQEQLEEMHQEFLLERQLRTDWDFVMSYFDLNEEMTVGEFAKALHSIQDLGWDVTACDLMEELF